MEAVVIIPARMAATRFPGKPLAKLAGLSMIAHCFLRAKLSKRAKEVFVATCDEEIAEEIRKLNGQAIMTSTKHERASDRTAEALCQLQSSSYHVDVVVMLQGDEPLIHPDAIDQLILQHQQQPHVSVFNLTQYINNDEDFHSVNTVKLLTNLESEILVFSREAIPSTRLKKLLDFKPRKQLGVISFRQDALLDFYQLSPTPLEKIESIDMMRFLEYGRVIKELLIDQPMFGVDTPEDAKKVESYLIKDPLYQKYKIAFS